MNSWLFAFAVTLVVELLILFLFFRRSLSIGRILLMACVVNAVTHPVVWFVIPQWVSSRAGYLLAAEGFALVVEAVGIYFLMGKRSFPNALLASAVANAASYLAGLVLFIAATGRIP